MKTRAVTRDLILTICWIVYSLLYVARLNLSVATPGLESAGIFDKARIGIMSGLFFFSYAGGQIINGRLGDVLHPRIMLTIGLATSGICNLAVGLTYALASGAAIVGVLWAVNGYAQSMIWGPIMRVVAVTCEEPAKRHSATSAMSIAAGTATILGYLLVTVFVESIGLTSAFVIPGAISMTSALAVLLFLRTPMPPRTEKKRVPLYKLAWDRRIRPYLLPTFLHGIIKDNLLTWLPSLLAVGLAGWMRLPYILLSPIMMLVGRLICPLVLKLFRGSERSLLVASFVGIVVSILPLFFFPTSPTAISVSFSVISVFISMINGTLLAFVPMHVPEQISATAGVLDFVTYMGAAVSMFALSVALERGMFVTLYWVWLACAVLSAFLLLLRIPSRRSPAPATATDPASTTDPATPSSEFPSENALKNASDSTTTHSTAEFTSSTLSELTSETASDSTSDNISNETTASDNISDNGAASPENNDNFNK